jgi:hypothetical protein
MADKKTPKNRRVGDGTPGPGRPKGKPNNATITAREAIARVLDSNAENLGRWLSSVAQGERDPQDAEKWLRRPDPGLALKLAMDMAEYHIPKLARTEINGEIGIRGSLIITHD